MGKIVNEFLQKNFANVFNYNFTSAVEQQLDIIASGDVVWHDIVNNVYKQFHPKVKKLGSNKTKKHKDKLKRLLGKNKDGENVYCRLGQYGPIIQFGDENCTYAALEKDQTLETITLKDALNLTVYPKKSWIT